jgi:hypothetical protein
MRSPVSQADVLETHITNATICLRMREQINAIIDYDESKAER